MHIRSRMVEQKVKKKQTKIANNKKNHKVDLCFTQRFRAKNDEK